MASSPPANPATPSAALTLELLQGPVDPSPLLLLLPSSLWFTPSFLMPSPHCSRKKPRSAMVARSSIVVGNEPLRPGSGACLVSDLTCGSTAPSSSWSRRRLASSARPSPSLLPARRPYGTSSASCPLRQPPPAPAPTSRQVQRHGAALTSSPEPQAAIVRLLCIEPVCSSASTPVPW